MFKILSKKKYNSITEKNNYWIKFFQEQNDRLNKRVAELEKWPNKFYYFMDDYWHSTKYKEYILSVLPVFHQVDHRKFNFKSTIKELLDQEGRVVRMPIKRPNDFYKDILLGVSTGDALGVPVEFTDRETLTKNPIKTMTGFGRYGQQPGTWSDDSSLTFCLAEALTEEKFTIEALGSNFQKWYHDNYWTARGEVFDCGEGTSRAIEKLTEGTRPEESGNISENSNGNGSLMRILPIVALLSLKQDPKDWYEIVKKISSITHAHQRSIIACFYYVEFAMELLEGKKDKFTVYKELPFQVVAHIRQYYGCYFNDTPTELAEEINRFDRLLKGKIYDVPETDILSDGYVVHTLEASIWCLMTTDNYSDAVLKAVNLGGDSDTTAAVTGGLAGMLYGHENIPHDWLDKLARYDDIVNLADRLKMRFSAEISEYQTDILEVKLGYAKSVYKDAFNDLCKLNISQLMDLLITISNLDYHDDNNEDDIHKYILRLLEKADPNKTQN